MINSNDREKLKRSIIDKLKMIQQNTITIEKKIDATPVTELDLFISNLFKQYFSTHKQFKDYTFYCEEDHQDLNFPAIVLDPLDGTKEFIRGYPECCISLAIVNASGSDWSWLFNPFTGFELTSDDNFIKPLSNQSKPVLHGLVSRSESEDGLINSYAAEPKINFSAVGSIAFKLGLLASGAADFVVSLREKNLWDIAAGTYLCKQRGMILVVANQVVSDLNQAEYAEPLLWCHPEDLEYLRKIFFN